MGWRNLVQHFESISRSHERVESAAGLLMFFFFFQVKKDEEADAIDDGPFHLHDDVVRDWSPSSFFFCVRQLPNLFIDGGVGALCARASSQLMSSVD